MSILDAEVEAAAAAFLETGSMRDALRAAANARSDAAIRGLAKQPNCIVVGWRVYAPPSENGGVGEWVLWKDEEGAASFAAYVGTSHEPLIVGDAKALA